MTTPLTTQAFTFITHPTNSRVLYGVLKRLNVRQTDSYFDDAVSEGRLIYVDVYIAYLADHDPYDAARLRRYAYQHLYWRLLDWLRANTRRQTHQSPLTDTLVETLSVSSPTVSVMESNEALDQVFFICTSQERHLLTLLLNETLTLTEVASLLDISRPTLYKHRARLGAKLKAHFPERF